MPIKRLSSEQLKDVLQPAVAAGADSLPTPVQAYLGGRILADDRDPEGLGEYWRILARRKGAICLAALLGGVAAYALTLTIKPVYRAQTTLEVQSLNEDFLNAKNVNPVTGGSVCPRWSRT